MPYKTNKQKNHTHALLYSEYSSSDAYFDKNFTWRAQWKAELDFQNALVNFTGQCKYLHVK